MKRASNKPLDDWTTKLRAALHRETQNIVEIGEILRKCREVAGHGAFLYWLRHNFDLSQSTAYNYMRASEYAERQAEFATVANLAPSVLYHLAAGQIVKDVENKILEESRERRIDTERLSRIFLEVERARTSCKPGDDVEEDAEDVEDAKDAEDAESAAILDGPPPAVPPPQNPLAPPDMITPEFDRLIDGLKRLHTKPVAKFTKTAHSAEDLENIEHFIRDVRLALSTTATALTVT